MVVHVVSAPATSAAGKQPMDNEVIPTFVKSYLCYAPLGTLVLPNQVVNCAEW